MGGGGGKEGRGRVPVQGARQVLRIGSGVAGARVWLSRLEVGGRSGGSGRG